MDLLLITPPAPRFTRESFVHLGPALLKSHLSSQGKQVKLIDLTARIRARIPWVDPYDHAVLLLNDSKDLSAYLHGFHREEIDRAAGRLWELIPARDRTARVIGFSVFSRHLLKPALAMAAWLQRHDKKKKIVFGGWLFSDPLYHDITAFPWANHVVSGPGEDTVEKLTNGEPVSQRIISEPLPLKTLPCPVFENEDLLWYRRVSIRRMLLLPYLLTRGCRHQCQFCPSSRAVPEFMPIEKASTELLALQETYAPDAFFFSEVNLNNQTMYLSELCQCMLDSGLRTPWGGFASLIGLSPTLIRLMAKAGCRYLQIGIESGSKRIRTRFNIFKVPNLPEVESILANLRAAGIRLNLYFMHGFPHENEREFAQSVDWLHRLSRYAATCVVSIFRKSACPTVSLRDASLLGSGLL